MFLIRVTLSEQPNLVTKITDLLYTIAATYNRLVIKTNSILLITIQHEQLQNKETNLLYGLVKTWKGGRVNKLRPFGFNVNPINLFSDENCFS